MSTFSIGKIPADIDSVLAREQRRHEEKVRDAIRQNLADMVSDQKILVSDGRRTISIPVPEFQEYRIQFDHSQGDHVGYAPSEGVEGEVQRQAGEGTPGDSTQGGDGPGSDIEETQITVESVADVVFNDLSLPDLDPFKTAPNVGQALDPVAISHIGLRNQWAKRATFMANLRRQATMGSPRLGPLIREDLRFRVFNPVEDEQGGAVVLAMMDTSGSMGTFEKYLAKSFFFWTVEFLRRNYPRVELVFLAHDVRAREVDEDTFFHRGASGGTVSSSVYRLALDVLASRFPIERYNAYAFHFTDGGNLTSDNAHAVEIGRELSQHVKLFGYGEIHDTERNPSPLFQEFSQVPGIGVMVLRAKEDIFGALYRYFGRKDQEVADA